MDAVAQGSGDGATNPTSLRSKFLIEGAELEQLLQNGEEKKNLKIIDASCTPSNPGQALADHIAKRITADTVHFNLFEIRDKESKFKFMMPSLADFQQQMAKIGVQKD